jgi:hypothetical protein
MKNPGRARLCVSTERRDKRVLRVIIDKSWGVQYKWREREIQD